MGARQSLLACPGAAVLLAQGSPTAAQSFTLGASSRPLPASLGPPGAYAPAAQVAMSETDRYRTPRFILSKT